MIHDPVALLALLLGLVLGVQALERRGVAPRLFHYLPSAFWCYFLPVLLSTAGLLPSKSPIYDFLTTYVLSACLFLLLLSINLPAILKLGPTALGTMTVGALGIALGAVAAYALFARWLPDETWKGIGALSASWIGGNANMLAVKEGLSTPDHVFAPMVIVDTIITYSWMGLLVALSPLRDRWDAWVKADHSTLDDVNRRLEALQSSSRDSAPPSSWHAAWLISLGAAVGWLCMALAKDLPLSTRILSSSGWAFLFVTVAGIAASMTPAARLERYGASRWGYLCLYLLLAAIGAKAKLQDILQAPLLIVMAYVWVLLHAALLAVWGYWRRVPLFFLVTSSQANIGGTASTPIVAGLYEKRLASLGLLLAIAGNVIGTYAGTLIAHACHLVHR